MGTTTLRTSRQNALCDNSTAAVNGGTLELYALDDSLVSSHALSATAFQAAVNGVATANAIGDANAQIETTVGNPISYGIYKNSASGEEWEADVTVTAGGGAIQLSSISAPSGTLIQITSATHTQPQVYTA